MSAIEATAEVFVTAFKSLKPRQPFRQAMKELGNKFDAKEGQWS